MKKNDKLTYSGFLTGRSQNQNRVNVQVPTGLRTCRFTWWKKVDSAVGARNLFGLGYLHII